MSFVKIGPGKIILSLWRQINIHSRVYRATVGKKVKCTLIQALRLCTDPTAHRGSRGIALLFHDHGTRRGEGSASRPGRSLPPGKTRYPLYRSLGGPQGRSGQVREISSPTGIRSPDRPARSQSLSRLRYPARATVEVLKIKNSCYNLCMQRHRVSLLFTEKMQVALHIGV